MGLDLNHKPHFYAVRACLALLGKTGTDIMPERESQNRSKQENF